MKSTVPGTGTLRYFEGVRTLLYIEAVHTGENLILHPLPPVIV
jgi:hypothetical protein